LPRRSPWRSRAARPNAPPRSPRAAELRGPRLAANRGFALALHGGASDLETLDLAARAAFERDASALLADLLESGRAALAGGAAALDVVETAVRAMEDTGLLNAGRGSARNRDGDVQLDAAVMDGRTGGAGAVAAVRHLRNPVSAARLVMERSGHVLLAGADAERFAVGLGAVAVDSDYFVAAGDRRAPPDGDTVGAVARDLRGDLAAATSTGGTAAKLPGRIGDSPVIGAGTFAANASVAVSCTGQGEYFVRLVLAHELDALIRHRGLPLVAATARVIHEDLARAGGRGGLIAVSATGEVAMEANTAYMPRGFVTSVAAARVLFGR
jgi:beta-aspartyl-peptidase (threonine type)